jgi:energy-coupling factor transporter ATP-binding protein EcfA2
VVLAAAAASHVVLLQRAHQRTRQMGSAALVEQELRATLAELQKAQAELQRYGTVRVIRRNDLATRIVRLLAATLNDRTWLTEVSLQRPPDSAEAVVSLTGLSFSNADLGLFLNRVNAEPAFRNVALRYSKDSEDALDGLTELAHPPKLIEFKVDCTVTERPASAPAAAVAGEVPHGA